MIPFKNRFHGHNSLTYVYKNGQVVRSRMLNMKFTGNKHRKDSRVAVVVSKKIFKSAVRRNLIRRRIYEYIRPKLESLSGIYDIVVIVTSGEPLTCSYDELSSQLDQVFKQAGILN
jgi:ribonuclease P protein component